MNPQQKSKIFEGVDPRCKSKIFVGAIQNDNLSKGNFYGTWLPAKPEDNYMGLLRRFASRNDGVV